MEKIEFIEKIKKQAQKIGVNITDEQAEKFYSYTNMLLEWNEKINLTAITELDDIIQKHFIDSLTIDKYVKENASIIDVGTGAGFPGIPLKIVRDDINVTLLDALNKRINFLNEVIEQNKLTNIKTIHARAEEAGKNKNIRESFDIATSRAVAPLNVLVEYLLPLIKIGGRCICMKGSNTKEEIENSRKAISILGGTIEEIQELELPDSDIKRTIIVIKKEKNTPSKYPRKAGTPSKMPIV